MRSTRTFLLVLSALVLGHGALGAQEIPSPYRFIDKGQSLGFFVGWLATGSELTVIRDTSSTDAFDRVSADLGPQPAPIVGARYTARLTGPLLGEVSVAFSPSERRIYDFEFDDDSTSVQAVDTGVRESLPIVMADAGLRLNVTGPRTWNGLAPYVAGTVGVVTGIGVNDGADEDLPAGEQLDFGPSLAVGLKLGTDWHVRPRLSVNVEVSDRLWKLSVPTAARVGGAGVESEWKNNYGISVGGAYRF